MFGRVRLALYPVAVNCLIDYFGGASGQNYADLSGRPNSTVRTKTITNENLEIYISLCFVMEMINSVQTMLQPNAWGRQ